MTSVLGACILPHRAFIKPPHFTGGDTETEVITRPVSELKAASELLASKTTSPRPSLTPWERKSSWIGWSIALLDSEPCSLIGTPWWAETLEMLE